MIGFQLSAELKSALQARATANHRSLSQECERTLERSFSPEALFVDSVRAMEGPEAQKKLADYILTMTREVYGVAASNAGHAIMRLLSAWDIYGEHFVPNEDDINTCREAVAALNAAIRQSEESTALRVHSILVSRILNGEWKPNAPVPKESDLARDLGVKPEIVRDALDLMERQRLLTRRTPSTKGERRSFPYLVAASGYHHQREG
jgi:hypothetical protein